MKNWMKNKYVYSKHQHDLGKITQQFYMKLLPNSTLAKQRPSKVPLRFLYTTKKN